MTLLVIALVSLRRHRPALTSGQVLTWSLLAIFLPVIGPAAWLLAGRPVRSAAAVE
ncbi:PLDc N-terminal domain-containing protein [Leucobacter sp. CSA2]|uniref:PLDc N-terminal domain-containing protein n=2 Tax=Leucobacter edaphi TaxID=2796472 RepID=A0A934QED7_9MICO|nr:PLDc N-terminal domain-containing protein [Leucobacter edaphi]MBK0421567.1 PLDc N-terminal domain-containing protein [Leucobacter edaphi]